MICTTLNKIRNESPCEEGWLKLLKHLRKTKADDDPLPLLTILDSNGLDDALWCLRTVPEHNNLWRLYAVWCAKQVQHLMKDQRSLDSLDVADRHANGLATDEELAAARAAAWAAGAAAGAAAEDAAGAAARAAAWAAGAAAWDAAGAAARAAAWAAWAAARAAGAAAWDAARDAQKARLREILSTHPMREVA